MADIGNSITTAFDHVWGRFLDRLDGLSDGEYFWEPVPGSWSVRRGADGRWMMDGTRGGWRAPEPAPLTTIAWRIGHIGQGLTFFASRLFRDVPDDVELAASAAAVSAFLRASYQPWRAGIGSVGEPRWWQPLGSAFGPYARDSTADLALHVLDELTHHAAEVGVLRDLYLRKDQLGGQ